MRIIRGKYKGRRLPVPTHFKARPTTDFAKEGLFNILENVYVDFDSIGKALDLFAGTGSIGLELASRGCGKVISVEKDFRHWQYLMQVQKELQAQEWVPLKGDVFKYVRMCHERMSKEGATTDAPFDLVFADPPYALETLRELPDLVLPILAPNGLFVLEHGKRDDFSSHPRLIDHRVYGSVNFSFFK